MYLCIRLAQRSLSLHVDTLDANPARRWWLHPSIMTIPWPSATFRVSHPRVRSRLGPGRVPESQRPRADQRVQPAVAAGVPEPQRPRAAERGQPAVAAGVSGTRHASCRRSASSRQINRPRTGAERTAGATEWAIHMQSERPPGAAEKGRDPIGGNIDIETRQVVALLPYLAAYPTYLIVNAEYDPSSAGFILAAINPDILTACVGLRSHICSTDCMVYVVFSCALNNDLPTGAHRTLLRSHNVCLGFSISVAK